MFHAAKKRQAFHPSDAQGQWFICPPGAPARSILPQLVTIGAFLCAAAQCYAVPTVDRPLKGVRGVADRGRGGRHLVFSHTWSILPGWTVRTGLVYDHWISLKGGHQDLPSRT